MRLPILFLTVAVAGPLLTPSVAEACSCLAGLAYSLPSRDSSDVPLNPYIRLGYTFDDPKSFALTSATGQQVDVAPVITRSGLILEVGLELAPGERLEPNTLYTVSADGRDDLQFTTGSATDTTPPGLDGIASFEGGFDDGCSDGGCSTCGESTYLSLEYDNPTDDLTPASDLLYRVYISKTGVPDGSSESLLLPRDWPIGWGFCTTTYSELEVGETVTVRVSTIDAAGHESELSEPASTVVADDPDTGSGPGCGQRETPTSPQVITPALALLLLPLTRLLRRR